MTLRGRLDVFAVEDTAAQLCWPSLPAPELRIRVGDRLVDLEVADPAAPGGVVVDGLPPSTDLEVEISAPGKRPARVASFRTLAPPPGRLLARIATISDMHLGEPGFGVFPRIDDPRTGRDRYPYRSTTAAIREAAAWGADTLVVKGDITWSGRPGQWALAAEALTASPMPVLAVLGNHDVVPKATDGRMSLARAGIEVDTEPTAHDLAGVRLVLAHTADYGHRKGHLPAHDRHRIVELAAASDLPALVAMHHYPDRFPFPSRYPVGIVLEDGDPFLRELAVRKPDCLVTCGHTHRHRRYWRRDVDIVEVGSTKDYPGVWAGYAVHEGGIRQVVRRILDPEVMAWTQRTARSVMGLWGPWAAGRRSWRCFSKTWG
ncbi:MAG TPA: metallophosphoesterase [Acidimicrobiales bacterium]|nr:metallophosphoesterase [Acidimicrobiales bacterium]